jgi:hypothetical protein
VISLVSCSDGCVCSPVKLRGRCGNGLEASLSFLKTILACPGGLYIVLACVGRGLCDGLITRGKKAYRVSNKDSETHKRTSENADRRSNSRNVRI